MHLQNVPSGLLFWIVVNQAVETYRVWLTKQYKCYLNAMIDLIDSEDEVCQVPQQSSYNLDYCS